MAEPVKFEGCNFDFGPPAGLDEMVGRLQFFSNGHCHISAWKPSQEMIDYIVAGGLIFTSVMSGSKPIPVGTQDGKIVYATQPIVFPMYVGTEEEVRAVVSDTGHTW